MLFHAEAACSDVDALRVNAFKQAQQPDLR
jgi:hypothetical protein